MRVFVAGAAGVVGRALIPMLLDAGHEVAGTTRSAERARWLEGLGVLPVVVDVLDGGALRAALAGARPEVVIHQLTDLARAFGPEELAGTARLREVGTRHLVNGAVAAGARRLIAQSGAWLYADGPRPHAETDPLRDPSEHPDDVTLAGLVELERIVTGTPELDGLVLRYGFLYGGETGATRAATPLPRVDLEAAASAAALAVDRGPPGAYNIADDDAGVSTRRARELLGWSPAGSR